jgi:hypothetical protein
MMTEPTPLEQLTALLDERADASEEWRKMLPTLRARSAATSAVLSELARTSPTDSRPTRDYVDIVLAAPSRDWAQDSTSWVYGSLPGVATGGLQWEGGRRGARCARQDG